MKIEQLGNTNINNREDTAINIKPERYNPLGRLAKYVGEKALLIGNTRVIKFIIRGLDRYPQTDF